MAVMGAPRGARNSVGRLLAFGLSGAPGAALAVGLNAFLVSAVRMSYSTAYGIVQVGQMGVNYYFVRRWVVPRSRNVSGFGDAVSFTLGIGGLRFVDWLLYNILVQAGMQYLLAQAFSFGVIFFAKAGYVIVVLPRFGRRDESSE
jgi:putative flippase GtrA